MVEGGVSPVTDSCAEKVGRKDPGGDGGLHADGCRAARIRCEIHGVGDERETRRCMDISFMAWVCVPWHGCDLADRLARGFTAYSRRRRSSQGLPAITTNTEKEGSPAMAVPHMRTVAFARRLTPRICLWRGGSGQATPRRGRNRGMTLVRCSPGELRRGANERLETW